MRRFLLSALSLALFFACDSPPKQTMPQRTPLEPTARLEPAHRAMGQVMYVPIYSSILEGRKGHYLHLSSHLSIRNISRDQEIVVVSVDYYSNQGELVRRFIDEPTKVKPLSALDFFLPANDLTGGTGASVLVEWEAQKPVPLPVVEGIMVSTQGTQGVSFVTQGRVLESH